MKALSLTQPWATLVATGAKRIETRSWSTKYTGRIAIHASKGFPRWAKETCFEEPFISLLGPHRELLPRGAVIATATLMGCRRTEDVAHQLDKQELALGDYSEGRFAWFLGDVEPIVIPIPARGALGLWEWNGSPKGSSHASE